MMWDDQFWIMLLNHDFYGKFIQEKQIIDAQTTSGALISFSLECRSRKTVWRNRQS